MASDATTNFTAAARLVAAMQFPAQRASSVIERLRHKFKTEDTK